MDPRNIKINETTIEGVDINKLGNTFRHNWIWILVIIIITNSIAYLKIRYTPGLYQSESTIKLEVKDEASDLGIEGFVNKSQSDLLSGEIELIQSKLFLSSVLDSMPLNISFYSIGHLLNNDLYGNPPASIEYSIKDESIYNSQIYFDPINDTEFSIHVGNSKNVIKGAYGEKVSIKGADLIFQRNTHFQRGDEIGYYFIFNTKEALLNYLLSNLTVAPLNFNAKTIHVAFKDYNPFKAQAILNKINTKYLDYSNEQKNLATKQKIDWLTNELHQIEKKMEDYENYFERFTLQNKTNNVDEYLQSTVSMITKIDTQRFEITSRINEVNRVNDDLNSADASLTISQRYLLPNYLNKNLDDIQQLLLEQERLKLSYNESTFAFRSKQKEIDNIKTKTTNQLIELKKELLIQLQSLNQKKNRLEREFASMPDKSTQFSKNQRYYKLYEEFYFALMQSKSQFEIAQAGSTSDFIILSPATIPTIPISPKKLMIIAIGIVSSFVLIVFTVGILYVANNKITSIKDLEKLTNVPLLGVVPTSRYTDNNTLYVLEHPKSMVSEALRTLRTNLDFFSAGSLQKVIAISSTVSGEGKSFIAMNLGGVMAQSHKRVILLDLDLRKSKANLPTAVDDPSKGVSTILIGKHLWQDCLIKTAVPNLDYIPSGPHPPNPSELLLNGDFGALLTELKQVYDFVILDTPPVGIVTDGIMAMKNADISIYVFKANYSKKDFLFNLRRIISINKFSNITTVLNALPYTDKKGYGYGYYEESTPRSIFKKT